ncbi:hypothetical protein CBOM_04222 [Ceraceosorus bombacis]|uniref:Uncharacterized protein n=1 Tax=Ceraceosorus bombacis TaxID=401625 RepID=A0A0P1BMW8_9BASI|nr:hypothetical protein CBOM_04222 [Ceraceosorus bombacis]
MKLTSRLLFSALGLAALQLCLIDTVTGQTDPFGPAWDGGEHYIFSREEGMHILHKRDKSPDPAVATYQGCKLNDAFIAKHKHNSKTNEGIQMAECFSNCRISPNAFAYFLVDDSNIKREGYPYGTCTAFSVQPTIDDLAEGDPEMHMCGFWDRGGVMLEEAYGRSFVNMPMICPHNLKGCYSKDYYSPGGKLAEFANVKPTYDGHIWPPKDQDHELQYCECLNCGCPTPTYAEFQQIPIPGCDPKTMCKPYQGQKTGVEGANIRGKQAGTAKGTTGGSAGTGTAPTTGKSNGSGKGTTKGGNTSTGSGGSSNTGSGGNANTGSGSHKGHDNSADTGKKGSSSKKGSSTKQKESPSKGPDENEFPISGSESKSKDKDKKESSKDSKETTGASLDNTYKLGDSGFDKIAGSSSAHGKGDDTSTVTENDLPDCEEDPKNSKASDATDTISNRDRSQKRSIGPDSASSVSSQTT